MNIRKMNGRATNSSDGLNFEEENNEGKSKNTGDKRKKVQFFVSAQMQLVTFL